MPQQGFGADFTVSAFPPPEVPSRPALRRKICAALSGVSSAAGAVESGPKSCSAVSFTSAGSSASVGRRASPKIWSASAPAFPRRAPPRPDQANRWRVPWPCAAASARERWPVPVLRRPWLARFLFHAQSRFLRKGDNFGPCSSVTPANSAQFRRLHERQVVVGQEAFLDERLDHLGRRRLAPAGTSLRRARYSRSTRRAS